MRFGSSRRCRRDLRLERTEGPIRVHSAESRTAARPPPERSPAVPVKRGPGDPLREPAAPQRNDDGQRLRRSEPRRRGRGFARAPFALATDVRLDGVWASAAPEWVRFLEQRYDFATAELHTAWAFRVNAATATIRTIAFCARSVPAIAACEVTVTVDRPADLAVAAGIDPTDVPGFAEQYAQPQDQGPNEGVDGRLLWHSAGDISTLGIAYATGFSGDTGAERSTSSRDERGWFSTTWQVRARRDRRYRLSLLTAMVPVMSHARPDEQAGRLVALGAQRGFDGLRQENTRPAHDRNVAAGGNG